jgi:Uma2 family endonuclease
MTLVDYFSMPETVLPAELIDGVLRVANAPFVPHQRAVLRFYQALDAHAAAEDIGEVLVAPLDVILDPHAPVVLQPDLLLVTHERAAIVGDRIDGAPDLVVEILSPDPRIGELDQRVRLFAAHGVREIWLYNQVTRRLGLLGCVDGRVSTQRAFDRHERIRSTVLPNLNTTTAAILQH